MIVASQGLTWFGWVLIVLYGVAMLGAVLTVGDRRKPKTPGEAAFQVAMSGAVIVGILTVGVNH